MKRTHKFKELHDIEAVIANASSLTAAARALGVDQSTLHRWFASGKVKRPRSMPTVGSGRPSPVEAPAAASGSPEAWAAAVRAQYPVTGTDLELLSLATAALTLAKDVTAHTRDRLGAMGRFQTLVRQLNLEAIAPALPTATPARHQPGLRRTSGDPRALLMAVK